MNEDLPKAIEKLRSLYDRVPSAGLQRYLASLSNPKAYTQNIFIEGIRHFMEISNMSYDERESFFGDQFSGIHYNNHLAKRWNDQSAEPIKAHKLNFICPIEWDCQSENDYFIIVYKGDDLCSGLDKLLQGPTVIDCGMFCQLSIWFGIRYMLGNDTFNSLFGRTPFYLTQLLYSLIPNPMKPYLGNPLFPFFEESSDLSSAEGVSVSHVFNHTLYPIKHPGGNSVGQNCVVINGGYTFFAPTLPEKTLTKLGVQQLLLDSFNRDPDENDEAKLELYRNQNPREQHAKLGFSYGELTKLAEEYAEIKIESLDNDEFKALTFNFTRFCDWVSLMKRSHVDEVAYQPLSPKETKILPELESRIPYENRDSMTFATFQLETQLQKDLYKISIKFCHDVMNQQSVCVVLTGKAGIGKTASAVSCVKELSSRGRRVVWISEVMVRGWIEQAKSMSELDACRSEIQELLATKPHAVFLDDDNLVGYSGKVLLEEIYKWYILNPGKGLFITSNEKISFQWCYGLTLNQKYYFPPFPDYTSDQYTNMVLRPKLTGESMRASPTQDIMSLADEQRVDLLRKYRGRESVGVIINQSTYVSIKGSLGTVEFVPAISSDVFVSMTQSLMAGNDLGPTFNTLTPQQKKYTRRFRINKSEGGNDTGIYWYDAIGTQPFVGTKCKIIVVELIGRRSIWNDDILEGDCLDQLLRVINHVHDSGGKKVIILNNTKFSDSDMLEKIKEGIPGREKERTLARINSVLFSPNLISPHEQSETEFEGVVPLNDLVALESISNKDDCDAPMKMLFVMMPHLLRQLGHTSTINSMPMIEDACQHLGGTKFTEMAGCTTLFRLNHHLMLRDHKMFLIEHRNHSPELRVAFDKAFGLIPKA